MKKLPATLLIQSIFAMVVSGGCSIFYGPGRDRTGVSRLDETHLRQVDRRLRDSLVNYNYINVALVRDGQIVLTNSYGHDRLDKPDVYASVSKPVTAMLLLQLLQAGKVSSLDDDIGRYCPRYRDTLPDEYADTPITFQHPATQRVTDKAYVNAILSFLRFAQHDNMSERSFF